MASTSPEVRSHLQAGLRELRQGKVGAALQAWDSALALDPNCTDAAAFRDYVKNNRIRIAVHLGRTLPPNHVVLELPPGWPPPPARFCDPLLPESEPSSPQIPEAPTGAGSMTSEPVREQEPEGELDAEPYHILEIEDDEDLDKGEDNENKDEDGDGDGDEDGATTDFQAAPSGAYAVLEIVMDDEDEATELSGELPPPPESMDAPEMLLEAPPVERLLAEAEPQPDYLLGRADSGNIDSIGLEHLAGPLAPDTREGNQSSEDEPQAVSSTAYAEDAPTIARDPEGSPPRAFPSHEPPQEAPSIPASSSGSPPAPNAPLGRGTPKGPSPHGTLMGVGLPSLLDGRMDPHFGEARAATPSAPPPPMVSHPPTAVTPEPNPGAPIPGVDVPPPQPSDRADFVESEGSFSDDIPTRMQTRQDTGPRSEALIRPMPAQQGGDYVASEGSFSDDLPTRARVEPGEPSNGLRASPLPSDFTSTEGSFSDDLPTRSRDHVSSSQGQPPIPSLAQVPGMDLTEAELTSEPSSHSARAEVASPDPSQASLDPEQALALFSELLVQGEHQRCLELLEQVEALHGSLPGLNDLIRQSQHALEASLLESLSPLDTMVIPRTPTGHMADLDLDPRAAFLFTRIDGTLTLDDLLDISGMSRLETLRILLKLHELDLLSFEPAR